MVAMTVIKELVIRTRTEGVDDSKRKLDGLVTSHQRLAGEVSVVSQTTEKLTRSNVSAGVAFDRVQRSLDEVYRGQQRYHQIQSTLDRALAQGLTTEQRRADLLQLAAVKFGVLSNAEHGAAGAEVAWTSAMRGGSAAIESRIADLARLAGAQRAASPQGGASNWSGLGAMGASNFAAIQSANALAAANARASQQLFGMGVAGQSASERIGKLGANAKVTTHETTMMGAQFMDLGTQIASGGGLFLPLIQQGGQLAGQLGDRGAKGAVAALGQGLLSFVTNPVNLAVVGVAGLAAGLSYLATSGGSDIDKLSEVFKRHEATIRAVQAVYGEAARGLKAYASETPSSLRADLLTNRSNVEATRVAQAATVLNSLQRAGGFGFAPEFGDQLDMINPKFRDLAGAIEVFGASARSLKPDFEGLLRAADQLVLDNPGDTRFAKMRTDLLEMIGPGLQAQRAFEGIAEAMRRINQTPAMSNAITALDGLAARLPSIGEGLEKAKTAREAVDRYAAQSGAMAGTPLDQALSREKIGFDELTKSITGTVGATEQIARARAAYLQRTATIGSQHGGDGRKLSTSTEDPFERAMERGQDRLRDLQSEIAMYGQAAPQVAAYRLEQTLLAEAAERNGQATPRQIEQVKQLSAAYEEAGRNLARIRVSEQLQDDRSDLFRSPLERQIAQAQRQAGETPESSYGRYIEQTMRLTDSLANMGEVGGRAFKGLATDLRDGASLGSAFSKALARIGDDMFEQGVDGLWNNIMKSVGQSSGLNSIGSGAFGGARDGTSSNPLFLEIIL